MPAIALVTLFVLVVGYFLYGKLIAHQYNLDDSRTTPATEREDGIDFVPTRPFYLFGQHFSAISAAGPIAGPILACMAFGWLPCVLWIALGAVLIGAVHDFSSLIASVRHGAQSVAEVMREHVGRTAWLAMMTFIWLALIYVLVAFADITASTFTGKTEELAGGGFRFNPGGAVAAASTVYLLLAVVMGAIQKLWNPRLWIMTVIFVPATLAAVWLGTQISTWLILDARTWGVLILLYSFIAALLPVWLLLQPRGYLGGFILYIALFVGFVGLFFSGLPVEQPAFTHLSGPRLTDSLFPFLFVTIACGACSGFHGLVCSGTTSRQIAKESHCKPVGYGAMLMESFVARVALGTIMFVATSDIGGRGPGRIFGDGLGRFMTVLIGKDNLVFARTFGTMAFSTFVFDTIDVATRLGRYILQEVFRANSRASALLATLVTAGIPAAFIIGAGPAAPGAQPTYMLFWTLFGTANQLLAGLTLMGITVWLKRAGKRYWFTLAPMLFILAISMWSLVLQIRAALSQPISLNAATLNAVVGSALLLLATYLGARSLRASRLPAAT